MGNPGPLLSAHHDRQADTKTILEAAKHGPLQTLTDAELERWDQPVTIYPRAKRVLAWVRFGPEPIRISAKLMRSTPLAAGIEFKAGDRTFRCWVWGNAVQLAEEIT
ncbi:hypothetical protein [Microbacterium sp. NPDC055599]